MSNNGLYGNGYLHKCILCMDTERCIAVTLAPANSEVPQGEEVSKNHLSPVKSMNRGLVDRYSALSCVCKLIQVCLYPNTNPYDAHDSQFPSRS